ncbi:exported hypothetical protein [Candidatus Terasakiella magnetica]|nr:exported hypothetical protein [Candidatus Terasakiella magnetica]
MEAIMTKKITAILSAFALGVWAAPAMAAPPTSPDLSKAADVMAVGNPHPIHQIAAADEIHLENKRIEERRRAELSEWEMLFGRHLFPAMGVGGHVR